MDAQERLVFNSDLAVAVLGRGGNYLLVPLADAVDEAAREAEAMGYRYCGVLALTRDGRAAAECVPDPDAALTMVRAALGFAMRFAKRLQGDSVEWCERLYRLPDSRPEVSARNAARSEQYPPPN